MAKGSLSAVPKFGLIGISEMVCKDCAYKGEGKAGFCDVYPKVKPLEVINGDDCEFKKAEQNG